MSLFLDKKGFSLLELLVSIAIVSIITTTVIVNQSTYSERAALTNLADDISLAVFQAQAYGIGVREFNPGSGEFGAAYGLHFKTTATGGGNEFISWGDLNGNGVYDSGWNCPTGVGSECISKTSFTRGNTLSSICFIRNNGSTDPISCQMGAAHISFARPDPNATIVIMHSAGDPIEPDVYKGVRINLISSSGYTRSVSVFKTGQVSVQ